MKCRVVVGGRGPPPPRGDKIGDHLTEFPGERHPGTRDKVKREPQLFMYKNPLFSLRIYAVVQNPSNWPRVQISDRACKRWCQAPPFKSQESDYIPFSRTHIGDAQYKLEVEWKKYRLSWFDIRPRRPCALTPTPDVNT